MSLGLGNRNFNTPPSDEHILEDGNASPVCPLCATHEARYRFLKSGYAVYQCSRCRLEFLSPQPEDCVLASIYDAHYFLGDGSKQSLERTAELKSATARLYLGRLQKILSYPGGRILEVGCGTGDFLVQARHDGFEVHGIEYSSAAADTANQRLGRGTVQTGSLESLAVPGNYFDAVVACDVIEHVRDPKSFLCRARECLRPGGAVFLVTPSVDSWSRTLMQKHWMEYKVEHLYYFGRKSLRLLLSSTGFENLAFHSNHKIVSLDYVYHHFLRYPVPMLTPLVSALHLLLPAQLSQRQWKIAGSGVIVVAQKPQ